MIPSPHVTVIGVLNCRYTVYTNMYIYMGCMYSDTVEIIWMNYLGDELFETKNKLSVPLHSLLLQRSGVSWMT